MSEPPGGPLRLPVAPLAPGPPNGDLAAGMEGWLVLGREPPAPLPRGVRLRLNTTIVSPPLAIPEGAQALAITLRAPSAAALVEVRARPEDGGPEVELGVIEPEARAGEHVVGLAGLEGRAVRVVVDPVPGLGATVDVLRVGPVTRPLPAWTLERGAPRIARRAGRPALVLRDDPLVARTERFSPGPAARALLVAVRGDGRLRAQAGARPVLVRAGAAWRDARVPLPRAGRVALRIAAMPGQAGLELRDLGIVVRATAARDLRVRRSGGRLLVTATLRPAGARLAAELRTPGGARLARGRADAAGRVRLAARAPRGPLVLVVPGDRTREGLRARVPTR